MSRSLVRAALLVALASLPVSAAEFKVANKVYFALATTPGASSTTYFTADRVYDVGQRPEDVIVYLPAQREMIVLDATREVKAVLELSALAGYCSQLGAGAANHPAPFVKFQAHPQFTERRVPGSDELRWDSPWISYGVLPVTPDDASAVAAYRGFSDATAQLNTWINARQFGGVILPAARMEVNRALAVMGVLPREVHLTLRAPEHPEVRRRSLHEYVWTLTETDRQSIAGIEVWLSNFREVGPNEFYPAAATSTAARTTTLPTRR